MTHPIARPGMRIGLLGGSFDPPHAGHVHITARALRVLAPCRVWWLVSPGNPLKARGPADFDRRMAACRAMTDHPQVVVSDIERQIATRFTADTLMHLKARYPGVRFVWLMGADNLAGFHRWQNWRWIVENVPIAAFARPGQQIRAGLSPAARLYAHRRVRTPARLGTGPARWCLVTGPMSPQSSTAIRRQGAWP